MQFEWPAQSGEVSSENPDEDFSKSLAAPLIFSEGLAVARQGAGCGYIDYTGQMVIKPDFLAAQPFAMVTPPLPRRLLD